MPVLSGLLTSVFLLWLRGLCLEQFHLTHHPHSIQNQLQASPMAEVPRLLSSLFYCLAWVSNLKISFIRLQLTNHVHYRLYGGGTAPRSASENFNVKKCTPIARSTRGRAINLLLFL